VVAAVSVIGPAGIRPRPVARRCDG